jgi:hypothetical protein
MAPPSGQQIAVPPVGDLGADADLVGGPETDSSSRSLVLVEPRWTGRKAVVRRPDVRGEFDAGSR